MKACGNQRLTPHQSQPTQALREGDTSGSAVLTPQRGGRRSDALIKNRQIIVKCFEILSGASSLCRCSRDINFKASMSTQSELRPAPGTKKGEEF